MKGTIGLQKKFNQALADGNQKAAICRDLEKQINEMKSKVEKLE